MTTLYSDRPRLSSNIDRIARNAQVISIASFFLACTVIFSLLSGVFLTPGNLLNILRQSAPLMLVAVAMTFVITSGGIDLSIGSLVALVNALVAIGIHAGFPWQLVVLFTLLIGIALGFVQGWFIAFQNIPAFIVTLSGLSILRGVALLLTQGFSIPISDMPAFSVIGRGDFLGVPVPALIAVVAMLVGYVALDHMKLGRHITAIGVNPEAARRAGIPTRPLQMSVYAMTGFAAAAAGIIIASRLSAGSSNAAAGFELDVIAAVVLGGTALTGGKGTIIGTILGALSISIIGNGLILVHISPFFTQIVTGAIILAAIWLNSAVFSGMANQFRSTNAES
jgi:simple sugar transport system permease protein